VGASRQPVVRGSAATAVAALAALMGGCPGVGSPAPKNDFAALGEPVTLVVNGHRLRLWVADEPLERNRGLMNVAAEELADTPDGAHRGMLFVFDRPEVLNFWMQNTIVPLDIAYLDHTGRVVQTHTMAPLQTRLYSSIEPAQFAIELPAGMLATIGLGTGDRVSLPDSLLKGNGP